MNLSYEMKSAIGFEYVLSLLAPASCFGQERIRKLEPYGPAQRAELMRALDDLECMIAHYDESRELIASMTHTMMRLKDIRGSLSRGAVDCLSEVELFEIRYDLLLYEKLYSDFLKFKALCGLEGLDMADTRAALSLLDPDGTRAQGFFISDAYSPRLREIRQEKKNIEMEMRCERDQNRREELAAERLRVAVREEAEESRIRGELTADLRPYLPLIDYNIRVTADLDLLFQKARLALENHCARPEITEGSLYFESMVHPQIRDILREKNKDFTPVTIALNRGASVITGANMGGKSVALKAVALNTLLVLCGFYPFAARAGVPMFEEIHFIAEDRQSVEQGLSSFGAEVMQLDAVVCASQHTFCLIILDEFARGTNPDEGAVIVQAVAKYFNAQDSVALLATHYDNVALYAGAHYQVIGLRGVDTEELRREIAASERDSGVDIIARHMNYGLYRVRGRADCPRDALNICRMLGLNEKILTIIEKDY